MSEDRLEKYLTYPVSRRLGWLDRLAPKLPIFGPISCPVCGRVTFARSFDENLRETGLCMGCGATNRNRQIALVLTGAINDLSGRSFRSIRDARKANGVRIYNTEAQGPVDAQLAGHPGYVASEYLGPDFRPGESVEGVRHENIEELSFEDGSLDIVMSSDVFEHIADPYKAHSEVRRVLSDGGRHIFTVPFHQEGFRDDRRAEERDGSTVYHKEPIYHQDPIREDGILVYNIFALEMLLRLREHGFLPRMYRIHSPVHGILGPNGLVFEAVKTEEPDISL